MKFLKFKFWGFLFILVKILFNFVLFFLKDFVFFIYIILGFIKFRFVFFLWFVLLDRGCILVLFVSFLKDDVCLK